MPFLRLLLRVHTCVWVCIYEYVCWKLLLCIVQTNIASSFRLQSSDKFKELLVTNNVTLLDELTFDDSPAEVVRELKVGIEIL